MLGLSDLKPTLQITESTVECPVRGCSEKVTRQRDSFRADPLFQCPSHKIYISPTTFEYPTLWDNLLWKDEDDIELLRAILRVKRECRMERDNSEDAVTWNLFRYLERAGLLSLCMSSLCNCSFQQCEPVYWSYSANEHAPWSGLVNARREFGENPKQSSEPDLIVVGDRTLFWIEAKLTASNETTPSNPAAMKKYLTGGSKWFSEVFQSSYEAVAFKARTYELMRFWLLGSWTAENLGKEFCLVNLVRSAKEPEIETQFSSHIKVGKSRRFLRLTWEDCYDFISIRDTDELHNRQFREYFANKTLGYNRWRQLERAFSLP